jgi:pimeloyl-ACP methyl ester carboxylesterase
MEQLMTAEQVTATGGATLALTRQGSGDPVLLVPGGTGQGTAWAQVAPHLASRFTVVTMDRRARGKSTDGDAEYSYDLEAADVAAVLEAISGPVHVVGQSTGATVALLAATRSDGARSLALYEPMLAPRHFPEHLTERVQELVRAGDLAAAADRWFSGMGETFTPEEVEAVKGSPAWERFVAIMPVVPRAIRALRAATPLDLNAVGRIGVPVLLLVGELTTTPLALEGLDELERALPDARRAIIPGQRHLANVFAPETLAERITAFLDSIGQR